MVMARCSVFALLILAVQGGTVDLVQSLGGKQMSLPTFASFFQQHLGDVQESSKHERPSWKKQAEVYLGLLQSMGSVVPKDKEDQTRTYVQQIIDLLTTPKDDIFTDATNTKTTMQETLNTQFDLLKTSDKKAETLLDSLNAENTVLKTCYKDLHDLEDDHADHCGEHDRPASCVRMDNTRKHTFDVSSKFTWKCNFTAGQDPEKCAGDGSSLVSDLNSHKNAMQLAKATWKAEKVSCEAALKAIKDRCTNTAGTLATKRAACQVTHINTEDFMCVWREWIQKRTSAKSALTTAQTEAPNLLPPKKKEWKDLNLIICMLRTFKDRTNMTFMEQDYPTCEAEVAGLAWVGSIDILEAKTQALLAASKFNDSPLNINLAGGLAEFYVAEYYIANKYETYIPAVDRPAYGSKSVKFFTTPEVQALATVFAEIAAQSAGKSLPASCAGYASIAGEADCSSDNLCKYFDVDSSGSAHSVTATCPLDKGGAGNMVAKKVCSAGLRIQ